MLSSSGWYITVCNFNNSKNLHSNWSIQLGKTKVSFQVHKQVRNIEEVHGKFDLIVFTEAFFGIFSTKISKFRGFLNDKTKVIVDCNECPWFFEKVNDVLDTVVLAMYSDIDCRRLSSKSNMFILVGDKSDLTLYLGVLTGRNKKPNVELILENAETDEALSHFVASCKARSVILVMIPFQSYHMLIQIIWKNLIRVICFHTLSIVFEEKDVLALSNSSFVVPLMKGTYQELLYLSDKLNLKLFPSINSPKAISSLQLLILMERDRYLKRKSELKLDYNDLDSNQLYYNFVNGFSLTIICTLNFLLNQAFELDVDAKYLESLNSFLIRLISIRTSQHSNFFYLRKRMLQFDPISGIPPKKNMMNFPPFNPLPIPSPPKQFFNSVVVMMVRPEVKADYPKDDASFVSVDSAIKDIVNEYAPDTFYDTQEASDISSPTSTIAQDKFSYPSGNLSLPKHPQNTGQQMASYQSHSRFYYTSAAANQYSPVLRKASSFHHLQPTITKNTSVQQLKETHSSIMEAVQFYDCIYDQNTRYGKYDTSTAFANSANNSRSSQSSSKKNK
ncbi:hypothetical protein PSN45_004078 [Yamadazyma tenuis]|nr:hypothetical protein PSN45_004078 [Yamadazyma tenuis]